MVAHRKKKKSTTTKFDEGATMVKDMGVKYHRDVVVAHGGGQDEQGQRDGARPGLGRRGLHQERVGARRRRRIELCQESLGRGLVERRIRHLVHRGRWMADLHE